ncbi:hypothetical protein BJ546DRAFT_293409 [Cryomyces antarcticus]
MHRSRFSPKERPHITVLLTKLQQDGSRGSEICRAASFHIYCVGDHPSEGFESSMRRQNTKRRIATMSCALSNFRGTFVGGILHKLHADNIVPVVKMGDNPSVLVKSALTGERTEELHAPGVSLASQHRVAGLVAENVLRVIVPRIDSRIDSGLRYIDEQVHTVQTALSAQLERLQASILKPSLSSDACSQDITQTRAPEASETFRAYTEILDRLYSGAKDQMLVYENRIARLERRLQALEKHEQRAEAQRNHTSPNSDENVSFEPLYKPQSLAVTATDPTNEASMGLTRKSQDSTAALSTISDAQMVACPHCSLRYARNEFRNHFESCISLSSTELSQRGNKTKCWFCATPLESRKDYRRHLRSCLLPIPYICDICHCAFQTERKYAVHRFQVHGITLPPILSRHLETAAEGQVRKDTQTMVPVESSTSFVPESATPASKAREEALTSDCHPLPDIEGQIDATEAFERGRNQPREPSGNSAESPGSEQTSIFFEVPADILHLIKGVSGEGIGALRRATNCRIDISRRRAGEARLVKIVGDAADAVRAREHVLSIVRGEFMKERSLDIAHRDLIAEPEQAESGPNSDGSTDRTLEPGEPGEARQETVLSSESENSDSRSNPAEAMDEAREHSEHGEATQTRSMSPESETASSGPDSAGATEETCEPGEPSEASQRDSPLPKSEDATSGPSYRPLGPRGVNPHGQCLDT